MGKDHRTKTSRKDMLRQKRKRQRDEQRLAELFGGVGKRLKKRP